jgi:hypothetical protein
VVAVPLAQLRLQRLGNMGTATDRRHRRGRARGDRCGRSFARGLPRGPRDFGAQPRTQRVHPADRCTRRDRNEAAPVAGSDPRRRGRAVVDRDTLEAWRVRARSAAVQHVRDNRSHRSRHQQGPGGALRVGILLDRVATTRSEHRAGRRGACGTGRDPGRDVRGRRRTRFRLLRPS